MTGHFLYTEEDAQQLIYDAMFNAPPCRHWAMSIPCLSCLSKIAAAALSSANRLVPPGSEVREEWGNVAPTGDSVPAANRMRAEEWERRLNAPILRRMAIYGPWSPVPDTEERDDA